MLERITQLRDQLMSTTDTTNSICQSNREFVTCTWQAKFPSVSFRRISSCTRHSCFAISPAVKKWRTAFVFWQTVTSSRASSRLFARSSRGALIAGCLIISVVSLRAATGEPRFWPRISRCLEPSGSPS